MAALPVAGVSAAAVDDARLYGRQDDGGAGQQQQVYTTEVGPEVFTTSVGGLATTVQLEASGTVWVVDGLTSEWSLAAGQQTSIVVSGSSETVVLSGTSTQVVLSEATTIELAISDHETTVYPGAAPRLREGDGEVAGMVAIPVTVKGTTTTVEVTGATTIDFVVSDVSTDLVFSGTTIDFSASSPAAAAADDGAGTGDDQAVAAARQGEDGESTFSSGITFPGTTVTVTREATSVEGSLDGTVVVLSVGAQQVTVTGTGVQAETSNTPAPSEVVPTHYPMTCDVQIPAVDDEQKVLLNVLFQSDDSGTTFAEHVAKYADELISQIWMISNDALNLGGLTFTSLFTEVDFTGILGLASAAPMYTCMLSSLWAEALSNPQQYAKRDVPTDDEKTKLIVLFQKHEDGGNGYDLVELIVDETNQMISQINDALPVAATNTDFITAFPQLDVRQLLSVVSDAPIYTETVSVLFSSALSQYSATLAVTSSTTTSSTSTTTPTTSTTTTPTLSPTTVSMTTRTFVTSYTYSTNYISGTVTVPTVVMTTVTSISTGPVVVTLHVTAEARDDLPTVTTVITSDALGVPVGETRWVTVTIGGRKEGSTVMVTEIVGAPNTRTGPAGGIRADGGASTVETTVFIKGEPRSTDVTVTKAPSNDNDNRGTTIIKEEKGESKDVTVVREGNQEVTVNSERDGVMYYTRVIDGHTYTFSIAMQTKNAAFKRVAGMGCGLMGLAAMLL